MYKISQTVNRFLVLLVLVLHVAIKGTQNFQNWKQTQAQPRIFIISSARGSDNANESADDDDAPSFTAGAAIVVAVVFVATFLVHSGSR